jgi:hypothetical protein
MIPFGIILWTQTSVSLIDIKISEKKFYELEANRAQPYRRLLFLAASHFCAADRCFFHKFISMKVLTEKEINQACELTLTSLYRVNPLLQTLPPDFAEAKAFFEYFAHHSIKYGMLFGYYEAEKLVAVMFNYPVSVYMNLNLPHLPNAQIFQLLAHLEQPLANLMERSLQERSELHQAIFCDWIAVHPDMHNKQIE